MTQDPKGPQTSGSVGYFSSDAMWDDGQPGGRTSLHLLRNSRPSVFSLFVIFIAYLLAAGFGQWMMVIPDISITVWPPNGIILAAMLLHPRQSWPWWIAVAAAGELTANAMSFHNPFLPALGYVAANACEVLFGAFVLAPILNPPLRQFATLRQVLAFLGLGVLLAPVVGATLISLIDALIGKNSFAVIWPLLWLGDATGILIATPLVICAAALWRDMVWPGAGAVLEASAIALLLAGLAIWHLSSDLPNAFLLFVPVLWAALRFRWVGTSLSILMMAVVIGYFAQKGYAPVPAENVAYRHAMLQALIMVAASMGLIAAAMIDEQQTATAKLTEANASLENRVAERTREIEDAERRFRATFENAAVGIAMVSADGLLQRVNEAIALTLGYDVAEMEGHSLDRFTHADDLSIGHIAMDELRRGEADSYEVEKRYVTKNGDTVWGHTSVSCVRNADGTMAYAIKVIQNITDRKRAEEVRQLLMAEVNHRSKNMLATIQAIARQTAAKTPRDFMDNFGRRLQALAANQDLLVKSGWNNVDVEELVRSQLAHFGALLDNRIVISGPSVRVAPTAAQAIGMALHELGTNAAKHGALSNDTGRVEIDWSVADGSFRIEWREIGGPPVTPPSTHGFGTTVLDMMVKSTINGEVRMDYAETGFCWTLKCQEASLRQAPPPQSA